MAEDLDPTIDLSKYSARVYTGRPNGQAARKKFNVEEKYRSFEHVEVRVPEDTKTLNSSFLLGLLGDLIVESGSEEDFLNKVEFKMPSRYKKQLDVAIHRALFNNKNDPSLI